MQDAMIVAKQVLIIFIYIAIGMVGTRRKLLTEESASVLSNMSLILAMPMVIISSFQRPLEMDLLKNLGIVFILAFLTHGVSIGIATLFVKKNNDNRYRIERFAVSFANSGYMAIPLVSAVIGDIGVYYLSAFIGVFNILTWTIGLSILSPKNKINVKKALLNPGVVGLGVGIILHLFGVTLPETLGSVVTGLSGLNTPLSMITAGIFLTHVNLKKVLTNGRLYYTSLLKLIVVPAIVILLLGLSGLSWRVPGGNYIVLTVVLACACPTAGATVQFSAKFNTGNSDYGAEIVAVTTLFSLITLPLASYLTGFILT